MLRPGLALFASGKGANALADLGAGIISFLTGTKNPIDQAIELGNNAAKVQAGADAFNDFAEALGKFSNIDVDFDSEKFARELGDATKTLEAVIEGGRIDGIFTDKFTGLANLSEEMDTAILQIEKIQGALNMTGGNVTMSAPSPMEGLMVNTLSAENAILRIPDTGSPSNTTNVVKAGDNVRGGDTFLITSSTAEITDSLQDVR